MLKVKLTFSRNICTQMAATSLTVFRYHVNYNYNYLHDYLKLIMVFILAQLRFNSKVYVSLIIGLRSNYWFKAG